jgi:hypothetical protein
MPFSCSASGSFDQHSEELRGRGSRASAGSWAVAEADMRRRGGWREANWATGGGEFGGGGTMDACVVREKRGSAGREARGTGRLAARTADPAAASSPGVR